MSAGFSLAAARQNDAFWAQAIIDELGIIPVTKRLIPILPAAYISALTLRALSETNLKELPKDSSLIAILRRWTGPWDVPLAARLVEAFNAHFRATAAARTSNNLLRELFFKLARQADPLFYDMAAAELGNLEELGCWRNTAVEFLHILRFRRDMLQSLTIKTPRSSFEP